MPEWTLPSEPASVPLARQLATDALPGLSPDVLDSVILVVSELVTNCVRHARTTFQLKITRTADQVRIDVTDHSFGRPEVKTPPPTAPHGRGLQIVQVLARRWGVITAPSGVGKTVWCTVGI